MSRTFGPLCSFSIPKQLKRYHACPYNILASSSIWPQSMDFVGMINNESEATITMRLKLYAQIYS